LQFFLKEEIERSPIEVSTVAQSNKLKTNTLEKQYKNVLSDYQEFKKKKEKEIEEETYVFPENFGKDMAIDETGLLEGELYTIVINKQAKGKKGALAAIIKGTKTSIITRAITDRVPFAKLVGIEEMTLDLSNSMDFTARQIAPNGLHTYDRFHVQQVVEEAVQAVRVKLRWKAIEEENEAVLKAKGINADFQSKTFSNGDTRKQLLARSRYFLFIPPNRWSKTQKQRAEILFREYPELSEAYHLSIYFRNCYEYKNIKYRFQDWIEKVETTSLKEMKVAAHTIKRHLGGILNYFVNGATNAAIESFHAKLKLFRQRIRGVVDKNFFFFRIIQYFA
jgi:transposase